MLFLPGLLFLEEQRPDLGLQRREHRHREDVGAHPEEELALQVAELEGCADFRVPEERLGFPGSAPSPVNWVILVVSW